MYASCEKTMGNSWVEVGGMWFMKHTLRGFHKPVYDKYDEKFRMTIMFGDDCHQHLTHQSEDEINRYYNELVGIVKGL